MSPKTISDFTWVSTAEYLQWLEQLCCLTPVNITDLWSMRVTGKTGFRGLLRKKIKLEGILTENCERLVSFSMEEHLSQFEQNIIAAFIGNIKKGIDILEGQVKRLRHIVEWQQSRFDYEDVLENFDPDQIPF